MNDPLDYQEPLRLPKSFGEDEKELVNLIKKDILENKQNPIRLNDVVGLVRIVRHVCNALICAGVFTLIRKSFCAKVSYFKSHMIHI